MAPGTIKKMKSRRSEFFGIRIRKGCSKPAVELRLPGTEEKIWRVMDDVESAKEYVQLVCMYIDGKKAFPPNHPERPHLEAFRKNEFEAFIWEEFQGHVSTKVLQDSEDGIDQGTTEEPMMATYAAESSCVQSEVGPNSQSPVLPQSEAFASGLGGDSRAGLISPVDSGPPFAPTQAGDVQLTPCMQLTLEQIYTQLQHGRQQLEHGRQQLEHGWQQLEHGRQQLAYERMQFADAWCAVQKQRGAREGVAPTVAQGGARRKQVRLTWTYLVVTVVWCGLTIYSTLVCTFCSTLPLTVRED